MGKKVLHTIFGLSVLIGVILMIGTAGSSDLELIGFEELVVQSGKGLIIMLVGISGLWLSGFEFEEVEEA